MNFVATTTHVTKVAATVETLSSLIFFFSKRDVKIMSWYMHMHIFIMTIIFYGYILVVAFKDNFINLV